MKLILMLTRDLFAGFCQCKIGKKFDEESQKCLSSSERSE